VTIRVSGPEAMLRLGGVLSGLLAGRADRPPLLLEGELGAGKTTLVRGLVAALPGAERAEVSSPSFTLANVYPTRPEVAHFDLYRLEGRAAPEELFEALEQAGTWVVVEWAGHLPCRDWPEHALLVAIAAGAVADERTVTIAAAGHKAAPICDAIAPELERRAQSLASQGVPIR
jgi:tRNA threonylcarbamoyladenosine biosynthesis protein TsaE